jgi:hypothetical protein
MIGPKTAEKVVLATCALHNCLSTREVSRCVYLAADAGDVDDPSCANATQSSRRDETGTMDCWLSLPRQGNRGHSASAKDVRDFYRDYFNGVGQVAWQLKMISC